MVECCGTQSINHSVLEDGLANS